MTEIEERGGRRRWWGVPAWAWVAGLAVGSVIGLMMFDGAIVGLIFGISIGTAFAFAFSSTAGKRDDS